MGREGRRADRAAALPHARAGRAGARRNGGDAGGGKGPGQRLGKGHRESILSRKYVVPFVLACIILACNQATGVNSIIGYNATILIQADLNDKQAHLGYVVLTLVNFLMTMGGVLLVDRKGRKFLLSLGSAGIIDFAGRGGTGLPPDRAAARGLRGCPAGPGERPIRSSPSLSAKRRRRAGSRPAAPSAKPSAARPSRSASSIPTATSGPRRK